MTDAKVITETNLLMIPRISIVTSDKLFLFSMNLELEINSVELISNSRFFCKVGKQSKGKNLSDISTYLNFSKAKTEIIYITINIIYLKANNLN